MFTVYKQIDPRNTVLVLTSPLDQQATLGLETFILGAKELGSQHIVLDLSAITWIGSFALDQLVRWHHQMKPQNLHFSIVNPSPSLRETLNQAHLSDLVPIFPSQEEAINHYEASSWEAVGSQRWPQESEQLDKWIRVQKVGKIMPTPKGAYNEETTSSKALTSV